MKLGSPWQVLEKSSNIKFHENPPNGIRVVPWRRSDKTKLVVTFHSLADVPKKSVQDIACSVSPAEICCTMSNLLSRCAVCLWAEADHCVNIVSKG
jgi:hypothetical protein